MGFLDELNAQPEAALFIFPILWLLSFFMLRSILSELLKMHKSKTAVKKIEKQYTFRQKLCLHHVAEHTEHAVKFTRFMIRMHHFSFWTMLICLLSGLILSYRWFLYLLAGRFLIFDVPVMFVFCILDAHPLNRRRYRMRFTKYHNTSDKTSLF